MNHSGSEQYGNGCFRKKYSKRKSGKSLTMKLIPQTEFEARK